LYLRVGGWAEIQHMSYWRFIEVIKTAVEEAKIKSGKPLVRTKLYKSQKDMIQRTKELMKEHGR